MIQLTSKLNSLVDLTSDDFEIFCFFLIGRSAGCLLALTTSTKLALSTPNEVPATTTSVFREREAFLRFNCSSAETGGSTFSDEATSWQVVPIE